MDEFRILTELLDEELERVKIVMVKKHGGSLTAWSKIIGMKQQSLDFIMKGKQALTLDLVNKILKTYPDVSAEWLIRGKGSMYGTSTDGSDKEAIVRSQQADLEMLKKKLTRQSEEIADLTETLKKKTWLIEEFSKA